MKISTLLSWQQFLLVIMIFCLQLGGQANGQTLAFPGADGFGRYAQGARASATKEVYIVTNLNDSGAGSFRDAVSKPGRVVVFAVGGIIRLATDVVVAANTTIAGQTAPGDGIVIANKRVTFTSSNNTIARFLRIRLGATGNSGKDVSGLASGANMIFDHMSFTWAMDEVFSINYDGKGTSIDNITIQNSIIGQGLHRENHSAGGLIQTPDGGKISLLKNLYISNKTRNPKVKGVNEFVNNVVYNWGNGNRLGDQMNYGWSGEGYIMGGSSGVSEVNIINNYFMSGPLTPPSEQSPFSRGTGSFYLYGSGNYFDHNKNGVLDGTEVPYDSTAVGYPGITSNAFKTQPFPYPAANPTLTAAQAYQHVIDNVGVTYPHRDELDAFLVDEVKSKGTKGFYVYRETDLPLANGGLGNVFGATAPQDTDSDGMPDAWEDAHGLDKNNKADAVAMSSTEGGYMNIEVYVNQLAVSTPTTFLRPPSNLVAGDITQNSLKLSWTDNSDSETNFILERSINGTSFSVIDTIAPNITTFSDSGLEPNKTYYYRIKGITLTEVSEYASLTTKTATPPSAPAVPASPSPANGATGIDTLSRNLTWTGSLNTLSYKVYFGADTGNLAFKGDVTTASFPITGLAENTVYFWRVDAVNDLGTTTGDVWSFKTMKVFPMGIIGDWRFDETIGTVAADSSVYNNDAEVSDVPDYDWEAGKIHNAINLKTMTAASGVLVPHQDHLLLDRNSFTFALWVKGPAQSSVSKYLFHKGTFIKNTATGATGKWFGVELKDGKLNFSVDDDVTKSSVSANTSVFFNNEWNHLVVVRDVAAKELRIYSNGVLIAETADKTVGGIGGDEPLVIANTNSFNAPFAGMLDEMKAFNYVLAENDILRLYHTSPLPLKAFAPSPANSSTTTTTTLANTSWKGGINTSLYKLYFGTASDSLTYLADVDVTSPSYQLARLTPNTTYFWRVDAIGPNGIAEGDVWSFETPYPQGLVGDWKLDATSGTAITDSSPYQVNGTLQNITDYAWEAGKVNNGLNLKTVTASSVIKVPHKDNIGFDKNSFSVALWVKASQPAVPTVSSYLFHKGTFARNTSTGATGKWFGVEIKNARLTWNVDDDVTKSSTSSTLSSSTFLNNTWVHMVFVRDVAAKKLRIYRNGALVTEANDNTANGIGGTEPLNIANSNDLNSSFKGMLDEIKLFNYALTASDIAGLAATKEAQTITFNAIDPKKVADEDFDAGAASTSGLPISYTSSNTNVATIVDGKVHILAAGSSTITASQPGNASYIAASPVSQVLTVTKREQSISFTALPSKVYGEPDFTVSAIATSGLPVLFSSSNPAVATIENGLVHITGVGSTVISASQPGDSTYSAAAFANQGLIVVADTIAPTVPANIAATATDSTVTLTWEPSTDFIGVTGYKVYKDGSLADSALINGTTYTVRGLSPSVMYAFTVIATDNAGNLSAPASISVTTPDTQAPSVPAALQADKSVAHKVALNWGASMDNVAVIGYHVFRNGVQLTSELVTANSFLAERPTGKNVYEFTVKAVDAAGNISLASNSAVSANGVIKDNSVASVSWAAQTPVALDSEGIMTYPNPSQGSFKLNVNSSQNGKIVISVFNTSGTLVQSISDVKNGSYQKDLSLTGLSAGTYIVRVNVNSFVQSKTIIIN
ncbi:LamG-like jellyroll fold domain-containing protein [Paradesertivirga mongoliensis]|uniref:LamG-like jellyroll fold domain-containing protein n=1 Tax=Paradesertivirga mongoliensis TaxID=2100740 RepID=A0ABW4ZH94_9SPHI|nr:LamG-like jellyroll fold domain-containing protein [Pedobacter mongoliensis]